MVRFAVAICVAWVSLSCGDSAAPASSSAKRTPGQRAPATGLDDLSGLESPVRRAFEAHPEDFGPLPEPGPNDWLSVHPEAPQSVGNFWIDRPNRPERTWRKDADERRQVRCAKIQILDHHEIESMMGCHIVDEVGQGLELS